MTAVRKFTFDTSFDAEDADGGSGRDRPRTKAEQMRAQAFEEGKAAGLDEARAAAEARAAQAMEAITRRLAACDGELAAAAEAIKRDAVGLAVTLVRKALPGLARRHGLAEIEALVAECLEGIEGEPRVVIRVHDSLLDTLKARIGAVAESCGYGGRIVLLADSGLEEFDCRVEWADGGAERDGKRFWEEVDEAVRRFLALCDADAGGPAPAPAQETQGN